MCPAFTDKQKFRISQVAELNYSESSIQKLLENLSLTAIGPVPYAALPLIELFTQLGSRMNSLSSSVNLDTASMSQAAMIEVLRLHQAAHLFLPRGTMTFPVARIFT